MHSAACDDKASSAGTVTGATFAFGTATAKTQNAYTVTLLINDTWRRRPGHPTCTIDERTPARPRGQLERQRWDKIELSDPEDGRDGTSPATTATAAATEGRRAHVSLSTTCRPDRRRGHGHAVQEQYGDERRDLHDRRSTEDLHAPGHSGPRRRETSSNYPGPRHSADDRHCGIAARSAGRPSRLPRPRPRATERASRRAVRNGRHRRCGREPRRRQYHDTGQLGGPDDRVEPGAGLVDHDHPATSAPSTPRATSCSAVSIAVRGSREADTVCRHQHQTGTRRRGSGGSDRSDARHVLDDTQHRHHRHVHVLSLRLRHGHAGPGARERRCDHLQRVQRRGAGDDHLGQECLGWQYPITAHRSHECDAGESEQRGRKPLCDDRQLQRQYAFVPAAGTTGGTCPTSAKARAASRAAGNQAPRANGVDGHPRPGARRRSI